MTEQKKVLVAEDEEAVRVAVCAMLREEGYEVLCAENGEKAYEMALDQQPDLLLLDVIMPKKHGVELVKDVRSTDWGRAVPIVLLTNYTSDPYVKSLVTEGAVTLVDKNANKLDDLSGIIKKQFKDETYD